jgi:hypothetical protein
MGLAVALLISVSALFFVPNIAVPLPMDKPYGTEEQKDLLTGLLNNVYASFDFQGESEIYDALDQSLSGDLLNRVYLETMKSLELASQGGAKVNVKGVTLNMADFKTSEEGFVAECSWDVKGSVGHWGHIHERINRYHADIHVEPVDVTWKITRLDVLEEQRVK